jgi:sortase A
LVFPIILNIIGEQIANSTVEAFNTEINNIVDGSYDDALKNGEIDKEGYSIDDNGNRTSNTPLLFSIDLERLLKDSQQYNDNLKENQYSLLINSNSYTQPALNLESYGIYNGMYGYVTADTINMRLPIYLGTNNSSMNYGATHLTYTSLPIGGDKTNTVLAGHTGYIGRIFFDNIKNLQIGDKVSITNYWNTINYKVIGTNICEPTEVENIYIDGDKDLLTMFTCINGGKQRYFVICERS